MRKNVTFCQFKLYHDDKVCQTIPFVKFEYFNEGFRWLLCSKRFDGIFIVQKKIKRLPVVDKEGNLIGIVSRKDIMNYLFNKE